MGICYSKYQRDFLGYAPVTSSTPNVDRGLGSGRRPYDMFVSNVLVWRQVGTTPRHSRQRSPTDRARCLPAGPRLDATAQYGQGG